MNSTSTFVSLAPIAPTVPWMDNLIMSYPTGYLEVTASILVQIIYLGAGLIVEQVRPAYTSKTTRKMLLTSLRNHGLATLIHIVYVALVGGQSLLTRTFLLPYSLPSWREIVSDMVVALLLRDLTFWLIHRFWHLPGVYKKVHAKHHEILKPFEHHVWTVSYMTIVDFLFLYGVPIAVVAKVLEMNLVTTGIFALISSIGEQISFIYGDEAHDEHHTNGSVNYGVYGWVDNLFGTTGSEGKSTKVE